MQNRKSKVQNCESGFMGLEGMGSLLFYMLMLAGAALIVSLLFGGSKLSETQQAIASIRMNVQQMFTSSLDYTGLSNDLVIKAGLAPKKLVRNNNLQNAWGGSVTISEGDDSSTFTLTLSNVPQADCSKLATYQIESWLSVEVNSTAIASDSAVAAAAENCEASNTIMYTAR